jgi:class 3 adenylate cyclase
MGLTYLFTDIEGSTRLVQEMGTGYGLALRIHRHMLAGCVEEHGGQVIRGTEGDGSFFVFSTPTSAVVAALAAQRKIEHHEWPAGMVLRVRMGLHTGPAVLSGGEHVGLSVHEAARICGAAHGGQILCSGETGKSADLTGHSAKLRELGVYVLRGIHEPHALFQVFADDLEQDFPPPRGAVREGGARVSMWRRGDSRAAPDPSLLDIEPLQPAVVVELGRASGGDDAFRILVVVDGRIEEEFDGLTIGGHRDAATIVNTHSAFIRVNPRT